MRAIIEEIHGGHGEVEILGVKFKATPDYLCIGTALAWPFYINALWGYRQLGRVPMARPHGFKEREWVEVEIEKGEIVKVRKLEEK